jgi:hypothetical protein
MNTENPKYKKRVRNRATTSAGVSHTHSNKALLDSITQQDFDDIQYCKNAITAIANTVGIVLNADGTLASEIYTAHTHSGVTTGAESTGGVV